jgi:hypothetical protein
VIIKVQTLLILGFALGAIYGCFMGLYGVLRPGSPSVLQLITTILKVPLLFMLTLVVTFPSLYAFSTLAGSRLRFTETLRLLLIGIAMNLALLASFGPVTGFFTLCTNSYPFMKVLNVLFFTMGGLAGLIFMYKALKVVVEAKGAPMDEKAQQDDEKNPGEDEQTGGTRPPIHSHKAGPGPQRSTEASRAKTIFYAWAIIYGAVGAQMGWILRPFIGSPDLPFEIFRERESNFFVAFFDALGKLLE